MNKYILQSRYGDFYKDSSGEWHSITLYKNDAFRFETMGDAIDKLGEMDYPEIWSIVLDE
jgi:hypothetical protein